MTLEEKMKKYSHGSDDKIFTQPEMGKLWGRFKTARSAAGAEINETWDAVEKTPVRNGRDQSKRQMLLAWVKDPKFGDNCSH